MPGTLGSRTPEEELLDRTQPLPLRSKRTERLRKKQEQKLSRSRIENGRGLLDLPYELILRILTLLRPSDIFRLSRTSRSVRAFLLQEEEGLVKRIISARYACLARCLRLPFLLENMDPTIHEYVRHIGRGRQGNGRRPFLHVATWDSVRMCSCNSCILQWNSLCVAVDFAHWQNHLDQGTPLPTIERGKFPKWNTELVEANAAVVTKAMHKPLWYARVLEAHLDSTIRSIRRHGANKGNRRQRFRMTKDDADAESDAFLENSGPPTVDIPFHRDNYYMLEAFLPNRAWIKEQGKWVYVPAEQHNRDVEIMVKMSKRRQQSQNTAGGSDGPDGRTTTGVAS